jgi:hypothetical protein
VNRVLSGCGWLVAAGLLISGHPPTAQAAAPAAPVESIATSERLALSFSARERRLEFNVEGTDKESGYEVRVLADGLLKTELGADVNEPGIIYLPPPPDAKDAAVTSGTVENIFFFNELRPAPGWELVIRFDANVTGTWKLNGRFSRWGGELKPEVIVPVSELEQGENLLHVRSAAARVPQMYFRRVFPAGDAVSDSLLAIPRDFSGRLLLLRPIVGADAVVVDDRRFAGPSAVADAVFVPERWWDNREQLNDAALAVGRSLLSSQVKRDEGLFDGGFNLVYDPSRRSHRMTHWIWAWGPSIHFLLELSKTEAAASATLAKSFRQTALEAAERSLAFEITEPGHPAIGVSSVRWEPSRATPQGWAEYISTADSLFMAGWGWMSAYEATKQPKYLERTKNLVTAAERLMSQYPVIPQDWIVERNRWTPHTLDESVFGTIGFRRLFEATREENVARAGRRFLDSHLEHMGRENGLLARAWMREEDKEIWDPDIKGHAWVIEGYLDAHRLSGDVKYLELARQLAQRVIDCQSPDGSWTYLFKQAGPEDAADDKGTAIWAYLFYDLYKSTRDPEHLAAGRRALGWCLRQQYRGDDPNLDGAIFHSNAMAYVRRRPLTILYTTTFFGLALLEELALSEEHH